MPSLHRVLSVALLLFAAGLQAAAEQAKPPGPSAGAEHARTTAAALVPTLTPEEERAYGNRAKFFGRLPLEVRPDLDWRTAVSASLADAEPHWSQGFEELIIRDFFGDRKHGFYVDVGCYLPRQGSTTYDLEQRLHWTGVGIDVIARYGKAWKQVRPESTFVAAAVSDRDGETLQLHIAGPPSRRSTKRSSRRSAGPARPGSSRSKRPRWTRCSNGRASRRSTSSPWTSRARS